MSDGTTVTNYGQQRYFPSGITNVYTTTMTALTLNAATDGQEMFFDICNGEAALPRYDSGFYLFDGGIALNETCDPLYRVAAIPKVTNWVVRRSGTYVIEGQMVAKVDTTAETNFKLGINLHVGSFDTPVVFAMSNKQEVTNSNWSVSLPFSYTHSFEEGEQFHFDYSFVGIAGSTAKLFENLAFGKTYISITKL